mmetsp:Transcript_45688/g.75604  ORF Transcript_45688/g.75604 Transcript_45688/m.75604 type:complete len:234 (+) Transcript_45688:153-854(+)
MCTLLNKQRITHSCFCNSHFPSVAAFWPRLESGSYMGFVKSFQMHWLWYPCIEGIYSCSISCKIVEVGTHNGSRSGCACWLGHGLEANVQPCRPFRAGGLLPSQSAERDMRLVGGQGADEVINVVPRRVVHCNLYIKESCCGGVISVVDGESAILAGLDIGGSIAQDIRVASGVLHHDRNGSFKCRESSFAWFLSKLGLKPLNAKGHCFNLSHKALNDLRMRGPSGQVDAPIA